MSNRILPSLFIVMIIRESRKKEINYSLISTKYLNDTVIHTYVKIDGNLSKIQSQEGKSKGFEFLCFCTFIYFHFLSQLFHKISSAVLSKQFTGFENYMQVYASTKVCIHIFSFQLIQFIHSTQITRGLVTSYFKGLHCMPICHKQNWILMRSVIIFLQD